jgi:hypothetical protein
MKLTLVPDELEDEDMIEMVAAGLLRLIVVDEWKAKLWAEILPNIQLRPALALRTGAKIGWALRNLELRCVLCSTSLSPSTLKARKWARFISQLINGASKHSTTRQLLMSGKNSRTPSHSLRSTASTMDSIT